LPVSSSGHLEIAKVLLGNNLETDQSLMMTVVLHAATALSTICVFYKEIGKIFSGLLKPKWSEDWAFAIKILISMMPAVLVGLTMEDTLESFFTGSMLLVGSMLWLTAILLLLAERAKKTEKSVGYVAALIIGLSQAFAMLPGVSRSGATISTSVLLGVDRSEAARFSFLMVVPLILGKMAKEILFGDLTQASTPILPLCFGFVVAFLTGYLACKWMISLVKNSKLWWFSIYCFVVGAVAVASSFF
ncbi:MAG: undecaprenyl-diphosphate phosphatase, partial [Planctomycetota bacterium]